MRNTTTSMGAEGLEMKVNMNSRKGSMDRLRTNDRAKVTIPFG